MKHAIFFTIFIAPALFWGSRANAQDMIDHSKENAQKADSRTKTMTCELGLTENEVPKVYAINLRTAKSLDSAMQVWHNHLGRVRAYGTKLDKKRDVAMRHAMTADHYSLYLRLVEGDP